jgi:hypothetical protein
MLTFFFTVLRDFPQRTASNALRDSQGPSLDTLPLCLFHVQDTVRNLGHLVSLRFRGCIDEFDEIGPALMKARVPGKYISVKQDGFY